MKTIFPWLILILGLSVSCKKDRSTDLPNKGLAYSWVYDFTGNSNDADLMKRIKKTKVRTVFLTIVPKLLLPSGSSKQLAYTEKFKRFLDSLEKYEVKVHALILDDYEMTYNYMHQSAINKIEVFKDFCAENPQYLGHPLIGINMDIEPHATTDWHNATTYGAKEYIMKQFVGLLREIQPHLSMENKKINFRFQLSAAIAGWYDELSLQGKLPSGNTDTLKKYIDLLAPMIYFDGEERNLPIATKISYLKQRSANETQSTNTVVGINIDDYQTIEEVNAAIDSLARHYQNAKFYQGTCFFTFKAYCDKAGIE